MVDYFYGSDGWGFVRTKVFKFIAGRPKKCSNKEFPDAPPETELEKVTTDAVDINGYGEYKCKDPARPVTNDGFNFKLKCLGNGKFQNRLWLSCRERGVCKKTPPRPHPNSKLQFSSSRDVPEFDFAIYECQDPDHHVPGTEDGKFRVPCQRKGNFQQSVRTDWPTCVPRPKAACTPMPETPEGYKLVGEKLLYVMEGHSVEFQCEEDGYLAGNAQTAGFICKKNAESVFEFVPQFTGSFPACRPPAQCPPSAFPKPPLVTGLGMPQIIKPLKELDFIDYQCFKGASWKLYGDYSDAQFKAKGASIVDGKLRIGCGLNGVIGTVEKWPYCRDTNVKGCTVNSTNPALPPDFKVFAADGQTPVNAEITVGCTEEENVNDFYADSEKKIKVKCYFNGQFGIPTNLPSCRAAKECPATTPEPPAATNLEIDSDNLAKKEFDLQAYKCKGDKTLEGVSNRNIKNGKYYLPCKLDTEGAWVPPSTWPTCLDPADTCEEIPDAQMGDAFITTSAVPVDVGKFVSYQCKNPGHVTSAGEVLELKCAKSGGFEVPIPLPSCREKVECEEPPIAPSDSNLLNNSVAIVKEFEKASYSCKRGTTLPSTVEEKDKVGSAFGLKCGANGVFPDGVTFPTCEISECIEIPAFTGMKTDQTSVKVGEPLLLKCKNDHEIIGDSLEPHKLLCQADGKFAEKAEDKVCRRHSLCEDAPAPSAESELEATNSTGVREFQHSFYYCKEGKALTHITDNDDVKDNRFQVQCLKGGKYQTEVTWPACKVEKCVHSSVIPTGFELVDVGDKDFSMVGEKVKMKCTENNYVTDKGPEVDMVCDGEAGNFKLEDGSDMVKCRAAVECPNPPEAATGKFLLNSESKSVKEFGSAEYKCKSGGFITTDPEVDTFKLQCGKTGKWPETPEWPKCTMQKCTTIPPLSGFSPLTSDPVKVGEKVNYRCSESGNVYDTNKYAVATCADTGDISLPTVDGTKCREPKSCKDTPEPPAESNLDKSESTDLKEYDEAVFKCKDGFVLESGQDFKVKCETDGNFPETVSWPSCKEKKACDANIPAPPEGSNLDKSTSSDVESLDHAVYKCKSGFKFAQAEQTDFKLKCDLEGKFSVIEWPTCVTIAQDRKKRAANSDDEKSGLHKDIEYTMFVLFETQFMYSENIAIDVYNASNVTFSDNTFSKLIVDVFHNNLKEALPPSGRIGNLDVKYPVFPLCEQPTNAFPSIGCTTSGRKRTLYCLRSFYLILLY